MVERRNHTPKVDSSKLSLATVSVAQLVRASDCGSEGHGFKSRPTPHAFVAQLVEHLICNQGVAGSIPVKGSKLSCGVIGNTSDFGSEDSRFEPWRDN